MTINRSRSIISSLYVNLFKATSVKRTLFIAFALCACLSTISCSSISKNTKDLSTQAWLNSGELSFGAPLPQAISIASNAVTDPSSYGDFSYGFSPTSQSITTSRALIGARTLVLNTSLKSAKLMQSGKELASAKLLDTNSFVPGVYKVAHKQRNPLWYAPEAYFTARGLVAPSEGDKQRYLRGAFGDYALFVSPTEAIHSGPFPIDELSGIRIDEEDFAKIFYLIEVGDSISVE